MRFQTSVTVGILLLLTACGGNDSCLDQEQARLLMGGARNAAAEGKVAWSVQDSAMGVAATDAAIEKVVAASQLFEGIDGQAVKYLNAARTSFELAKTNFQDGDFDGADALLGIGTTSVILATDWLDTHGPDYAAAC